jgi:hypothetical protein
MRANNTTEQETYPIIHPCRAFGKIRPAAVSISPWPIGMPRGSRSVRRAPCESTASYGLGVLGVDVAQELGSRTAATTCCTAAITSSGCWS